MAVQRVKKVSFSKKKKKTPFPPWPNSSKSMPCALSRITHHGAKMANKDVAFYTKIINLVLSALVGSRNVGSTFG